MRLIDLFEQASKTKVVRHHTKKHPSPKRDAILQYIKEHPRCTKEDIRIALGITDKAATTWLHAMTRDGYIERTMYPLTRNGRPPSIYWVEEA